MVKQNDMDAQQELDNLMQMISPFLRNQVTKHIFLNVLGTVSVFSGSPDIIEFMV